MLKDSKVLALIAHDGKKADMVAFATYNRDKLAELPALFLSVSLTAAEDTPRGARAHTAIHQRLRGGDRLETHPLGARGRCAAVPGVRVFTRVLMRLKMRQGGHQGRPFAGP